MSISSCSVCWLPTPRWALSNHMLSATQYGGNPVNSWLLRSDLAVHKYILNNSNNPLITSVVCWLPHVAEDTFSCSSLATNYSTKHFSQKNFQQTIHKFIYIYLKKVFTIIFGIYEAYTNILWTVSDRILKQCPDYPAYQNQFYIDKATSVKSIAIEWMT